MFKEALQRIVDNTDGAFAGLVMGFDGIALESYTPKGQTIDINTMGMELSFVLTQVRKAADILELGKLQEISLKAEKVTLVIRLLTSDYFMAVAVGPDGNLGKGRYLMRVVGPKVAAEL